ncbi:MAG: hypothetical protein MI867_10240 [Pseudomonadales bacterium]|nr:hypothetical protein [Pseudomonadales bacterium]
MDAELDQELELVLPDDDYLGSSKNRPRELPSPVAEARGAEETLGVLDTMRRLPYDVTRSVIHWNAWAWIWKRTMSCFE